MSLIQSVALRDIWDLASLGQFDNINRMITITTSDHIKQRPLYQNT
jgi:hypothetical protein